MGKSFTSRIINLGRITIPKDVREELELQEGDYVQVQVAKLTLVKEEG